MPGTRTYNRNIYSAVRIGIFLLTCLFVVMAANVTFYSALGVIYNPIFHLPADFLNSIIPKKIIPFSTAEFTRLNSISDFYSIGDMFVGAIYLAVASFCTFCLLFHFCSFFYRWGGQKSLKYKLGDEGFEEYKKEWFEKAKVASDTNKALSDFESAQKAYWLQWNKFYSSDLGYEEWKDKVLNK